MALIQNGYQNYQMWNMYDEGGQAAEMSQIYLSDESNQHRVVALSGNGMSITLEGSFSITGPALSNVTGTLTHVSVTKNGESFFTETYTDGADWQNLINSFNYQQSLLSGNDSFTGSASSDICDIVQAGDGNDTFIGFGDTPGYNGHPGDAFYGENGLDTAIYQGLFSDYAINLHATTSDLRDQSYQQVSCTTVTDHVAGRDGFDRLIEVERLNFSDKSLALDTDGIAGQAYRIYKAAYDRTPDEEGLGFWIKMMDNGESLLSVANSFVLADEMTSKYGGQNPSDAEFLEAMYNNVLHRDLDQSGFDWWLDAMANDPNLTKAQLLKDFSECTENHQQTDPLIANGILFVEWTG